jgi:Tol biopolymer transport system component
MSESGRFVAFQSSASNLVAGDTNGFDDIFVRERQNGVTTRVSVASSGAQAIGGNASSPWISSDGQIVAFSSAAENLVLGDNNGLTDIFVHDRSTGSTVRISVASAGAEANGESVFPSLSADGRFVVFRSSATNLVSNDTTTGSDAFLHDRQTGSTTRLSISSIGAEANSDTHNVAICGDGSTMVLWSAASNLVPADTNIADDVFIRNRQGNTTERVSIGSAGAQANGQSRSWGPSISSDGRFVGFASSATNLVPQDTAGRDDAFVFDRQTQTTARVSVGFAGQESNGNSFSPTLSADGRYAFFVTYASNLFPGDTNGFADVYVRDQLMQSVARLSLASDGSQGNFDVFPEIAPSADGRFVAFSASASTLVPADTNNAADVFVVLNHLAP